MVWCEVSHSADNPEDFWDLQFDRVPCKGEQIKRKDGKVYEVTMIRWFEDVEDEFVARLYVTYMYTRRPDQRDDEPG
jgi:hypothetical protein